MQNKQQKIDDIKDLVSKFVKDKIGWDEIQRERKGEVDHITLTKISYETGCKGIQHCQEVR